jgi:hypothetical protein
MFFQQDFLFGVLFLAMPDSKQGLFVVFFLNKSWVGRPTQLNLAGVPDLSRFFCFAPGFLCIPP